MRFTVVTSGGEGDTRPIAALCHGLIQAGHEVCFFAEQSTSGFARALGVPTRILPGDMQSAMSLGDPMQDIRLADIVAAGKNVQKVLVDNAADRMRMVAEHARHSDAVLFSSLALFVGPTVAHELGKPAIGLWLQPISPTRAFPAPMMQPVKLPGWMNLLTYKLLRRYLRRWLGKGTEAACEQAFGHASRKQVIFDFPLLYGISPQLVTQPTDWPSTDQVCGQWTMPTPNWQAPTALVDFLHAGPAPIYVGFGSGSSFVRKKRLLPLIAAIAGRRAVFYPGWSKIDASVLPNNFFVLDDTPHDWLFPQTAMVIHHGGAGTTHSAARAGVPQIALPFGADQHFWANAVANAGSAPKFVKGAPNNADILATMIAYCEREDVRQRARLLGTAMSKETGIANTVQAIVSLVASRSQNRSPTIFLGRPSQSTSLGSV